MLLKENQKLKDENELNLIKIENLELELEGK